MGPLGLMGGTFDPPHYGHLAAAEEVRVRLGLQRILWIPAGSPPHKSAAVTPKEHRVAMVRAAIRDNDAFVLEEVEVRAAGPSFTVRTLEALRTAHPGQPLVFLMGSDEFQSLRSWYEADRIAELAEICVMARSRVPFDPAQVEREVPSVRGAYRILEVPDLPLSSSALRARVRQGLPLRYLTPDEVCEYIARAGLYVDR